MNDLAYDMPSADPDEGDPGRTTAADLPSGEGEPRTEMRAIPRISVQAFCETPDVAGTIEKAGADRRMAKAHTKVHMGGVNAAVDFYGSAPTPNLIIIEHRSGPDRLRADLERLAEVCDAGTKVVVVGHTNDIELYRDLIRRGVSEYLVAPISLYSVIGMIGDLYGEPGTDPLGRTIAFVGAKGGSGASTLAHNVSWSISRSFESDVILADLDLPFGTAGLDFNQDPLQGVLEAVSTPDRLDDMLLDRLLSKCSEHLSILAAPAVLDRTYDFDEDSFAQMLDLMRQGVPNVVLDVPHQWSGWVQATLAAADEIVIVSEPDLANLRNCKNLVDKLKSLRPNDSAPHLVLNKVGMPKRPEISAADFAEALSIDVTATVAFEPQLFGTAANNGQMISELDAKNPVSGQLELISQRVTGRGEVAKAKRSALAPLLARLRGKK